jgi:PAS domain S-box-containing protein
MGVVSGRWPRIVADPALAAMSAAEPSHLHEFLEAVPLPMLLVQPESLWLVGGNALAAELLGGSPGGLAAAWRMLLQRGKDGAALGARLRAVGGGGAEAFTAILPLDAPREAQARAALVGLDGRRLLSVTLTVGAPATEALRTALADADLGRWRWDARSGALEVDARAAAICGLTPEEMSARSLKDLAHPEDWAWVRALMEAHLTGMAERFEAAYRLRHKDGSWVWVMARGRCGGRDAAGQASAISGTHQDITARRAAEGARAVLLRELDHRVKNLFAVIGGLVGFTARQAATPAEMGRALRGRIDALARAHDLVRPAISGLSPAMRDAEALPIEASGTTVPELFKALLAPFPGRLDRQERMELLGAAVPLGPTAAAPLGLVVHELASNAAQHGAWSRAEGKVRVTWEAAPPPAEDPEAGPQLRLVWEESGGPAPTPPAIAGFGERLMTQSAAQLGGSATLDWREAGLRVELLLPQARLER